ncbi:MAG TPA: NYN domain-containing protein [Pirellulales bacterium]|nr:NYN domain-containing protein [Pirellulales bacterium]
MSLLIDGYNLMYAAGILGHGVGPGGLERSRLALLNFVAESLDEHQRATTTIVFDARNAPPGLPSTLLHRGVTVQFAAAYETADALIEELIRSDSAPRRLTVVSSDHQVQRAAHRRRAKAIDSDQWYAQILRQRAVRHAASPAAFVKPVEATAGDVEYWLSQFDDEAEQPDAGDIFPPGYGEDIEE